MDSILQTRLYQTSGRQRSGSVMFTKPVVEETRGRSFSMNEDMRKNLKRPNTTQEEDVEADEPPAKLKAEEIEEEEEFENSENLLQKSDEEQLRKLRESIEAIDN